MKQHSLIILTICIASVLASCNPKTSSNELSEDQLLDTIQYYTFQYFWDGAEPNSGMAYERIHMDDTYAQDDEHIVTTGGTGFGLMGLLVGIERGFISRDEGLNRFETIVNFLETADRFHGVWPHWLDGKTGKVKPFSAKDDGGDLVETAFLVQGLLAVKEYFEEGSTQEKELATKIDQLWREVEWNWYQNAKDVLHWHWSPNFNWEMNFAVSGYNECLIMYVLGASSPTFPISTEAYHKGWARNGAIKGDTDQYGYNLYIKHHVSEQFGGPLFWEHYSFLGLDPRNLKDDYTNYWEHNKNHVLINRQYCIENPNDFAGYSKECWGLTSSYSIPNISNYVNGKSTTKPVIEKNPQYVGYAGHCPTHDLGVISPTAALSSFPYAPKECMKVAQHFYKDLGKDLFGTYGFYDAFSVEFNWYPQKYLAIDQGPIVAMIENYRSALLWNLFMKNEDVQNGLTRLGFTY